VGGGVARVEAFGVRWLLEASTTMWVLESASPTGPTLNVQPDVEEMVVQGRSLVHPENRVNSRPVHYYDVSVRGTKKNPPK
jgi:hypothetical protein